MMYIFEWAERLCDTKMCILIVYRKTLLVVFV
jgi:hypothetical protein